MSTTSLLAKVARKVRLAVKSRVYAPALSPTNRSKRLVTLGSKYGGWTFVDSQELHGATIVSCGLGEDASFDVEFANRYKAKVIIVDPTPRSIVHFHELTKRFGSGASVDYCVTGTQPAAAYNLERLTSANFQMVEKALWTEGKTLKFFAPKHQDYVSHSIVNIQNDFRTDTDHIEVQAVSVDALLRELELKTVPLLKMDIEGAEIEVICHMMDTAVRPNQLLIEFDELSVPSKTSRVRIEAAHGALLANGYELVAIAASNNALYVQSAWLDESAS